MFSTITKKLILAVAVSFFVFTSTPSKAVVITSGCANLTSCTLAELAAGGTLTADDVLFDNFTSVTGNLGNVAIDLSTVLVTGITTATDVILDISINPGVSISTDSDLVDIFFAYDATVTGGSARTFSNAELSFQNGDADFGGVAGTTVSTNFNGVITELIIENSDLDNISSVGSVIPGSLVVLSLFNDLESGVFDTGSFAEVSGFQLALTLNGTISSTVPVPPALPLMLSGLVMFGLLHRRRKKRTTEGS